MAKKKTAKERREEQKAKQRKRQQERQREQHLKMIKENELQKEIQFQKEIEKIEKEGGREEKSKKSRAKAAGLKSTFTLGDGELLMTSFGKGNQAHRDKYIVDDKIEEASKDSKLSVDVCGQGFNISNRNIDDAYVDNPVYSRKKAGQDLIHCREQLEKMYFNKTFEDNIHIQLIYNILDIEKILAVQVNNIVFSLDNLLRRADEEYDDLIGYMGFKDTYEEFRNKAGRTYKLFNELIHKPQMGYFGTTFLPVDKKGKRFESEQDWKKFEKKCYYLFAVLGTLRQATAHGSEGNRSLIYRLSEEGGDCKKEACKQLDALYYEQVHKLNNDFLDMSGKDLKIFFQVYNLKTPEEQKYIVQEYYKFVVLKTFKNMGFSIKRLRETMIEREAIHLADDKYNSVRKKLYRAIDFSIYLYYRQEENSEKAEQLIADLRASSKEAEKEYYYRKSAEELWTQLREIIDNCILPKMDGTYIKNLEKEKLDFYLLEGVLVKETADPFSEMMYLLTIFLDGKEINILLTQLINRFDNINSFLEVMEQENIEVPFKKDYKIFMKSRKISEELRVINSFARMTRPHSTAKKSMFIEAAQILGYEEEEVKLEEYIDGILDPSRRVSKVDNKNGFRNFIINNVIESSRFKYLVRYGNPKKLRELASNRKVVSFVLRDIPDAQIYTYYNSCRLGTAKEYDSMREALCEKITGLHFKEFENVYQANTNDVTKKEDKECKQNSIRLYLTVLYLLQKNLIYVNSRYFLAFHCAERDALVYDKKRYTEKILRENRMIFAEDFVNTYGGNKKSNCYIRQNMKNADKWSLRAFRNCTEHLNAVRNASKYIGDIRTFDSYFELYHYLVQRTLIDQFKHDCATESKKNVGSMIYSRDKAEGKLLDYFEVVEKYNTYCKDFVKALNVPFAYNLPRYKNLSINELFDRNNYLSHNGKNKVLEPDEITV